MDNSASNQGTGPSKESSGHRKKCMSITIDPPVQNTVGKQIVLEDTFDAIFLTPSAVEKFVVPFYNSLKGTRDGEGTRILNAFASHPAEVYAIAHMPLCDAIFLVEDQADRRDSTGPVVLRMLTVDQVEQLPGSADRS